MDKNVKKILARISLLTIPMLLGFGILEYHLRHIETSYSKKKRNLENKISSIEILTLGSSQPLQAINPHYFSCETYNLADVSQTLYYDTELVKMYLERMPKLKAVIIPISYFSFREEMKEVEPNREYFYYHYWGIRAQHLAGWDINKVSLVAVLTPFTSLKVIFKNTIAPLNIDDSGWKCILETNYKNITYQKGKSRVKLHEQGNDSNRETNISRVKELVQLLQERGVTPIFVTMPVYKTYYQNINRSVYSRDTAVVHDLCKQYKTRYFNYFESDLFELNDFSDNDHLNKKGAEKFSRLLNQRINQCDD